MTRPADLRFNSALYPIWRPYQYQTIQQIFNSNKRFIVLSAPTGAGKSMIALGIAQMGAEKGFKTNILTKDTRLQDQYTEYDFPGSAVGVGRRNFQCILDGYENKTADIAPCVRERNFECEHAWKPGKTSDYIKCPYYKQRTKVDESQIRILNYPFYFLGAKNNLFHADMLICDEGHNIDSEILKIATVKLTEQDLNLIYKHFKVKWPRREGERLSDNPDMMTMALTIRDRCDRLEELPEELFDLEEKIHKIIALENKITHVSEDNEFSPILPSQFSHELLFSKAEKVVLMSATIFGAEYWKNRLGASDVEYIEMPSLFPPENRPIISQRTAYFNYKDFEPENEWKLDAAARTVDRILSARLPKKGIIHTVSYKRATDLIERSIYKDSGILILGQSNADIKKFAETDCTVLISPAITEGLDFPDEMCEYVIWLKVPFPNTANPVIRMTKELDESVYNYQTLSTLIQGSGRGMRHENDSCEIFILDSTWDRVYAKNKLLLPKWFKEAVRG